MRLSVESIRASLLRGVLLGDGRKEEKEDGKGRRVSFNSHAGKPKKENMELTARGLEPVALSTFPPPDDIPPDARLLSSSA